MPPLPSLLVIRNDLWFPKIILGALFTSSLEDGSNKNWIKLLFLKKLDKWVVDGQIPWHTPQKLYDPCMGLYCFCFWSSVTFSVTYLFSPFTISTSIPPPLPWKSSFGPTSYLSIRYCFLTSHMCLSERFLNFALFKIVQSNKSNEIWTRKREIQTNDLRLSLTTKPPTIGRYLVL